MKTPHTFDCGCVLEAGDEGRPLLVYCRLHNAAGDLLKLAKELTGPLTTRATRRCQTDARNLVRRVEG